MGIEGVGEAKTNSSFIWPHFLPTDGVLLRYLRDPDFSVSYTVSLGNFFPTKSLSGCQLRLELVSVTR